MVQVLEALNRLLDDNRELVIPETQEVNPSYSPLRKCNFRNVTFFLHKISRYFDAQLFLSSLKFKILKMF